MFARSDLPVSRLPDSFAPETTLHLGGEPWLVERAEPLPLQSSFPLDGWCLLSGA
jgi:hypothetical protein